MDDEKSEYLRGREAYERKRPTTDIRVPSGNVFKVMKLEALELLDAWNIIGVKPGEMESGDNRSIGTKMLNSSQKLLDEFVCKFAVKPRLIPSTASAEEKERRIVTTDLAAADKMALINGLLKSSGGGEGKALADSFPEEP